MNNDRINCPTCGIKVSLKVCKKCKGQFLTANKNQECCSKTCARLQRVVFLTENEFKKIAEGCNLK